MQAGERYGMIGYSRVEVPRYKPTFECSLADCLYAVPGN